jgi:prepilin-type N-terminal cleavage/methylation domain-containing protein
MKNYLRPHGLHKGFSIIELLVVITIIGILLAIVIANLQQARLLARDRARISDISTLQLSLAQYLNANASYPTTLSQLVPGFAPSIPNDPINSGGYVYTYTSTNANSSYCLSAGLESNSAYIDPNVTCTNGAPAPASGYSYKVSK